MQGQSADTSVFIHYRKVMFREHSRTHRTERTVTDSPNTALHYKPNDDANYSYEDVINLSPVGRYKRNRDGSKTALC